MFLFLSTVMLSAFAQPLTPLEANGLSYWHSCETLLQVHPGHASSVQVVLGADRKPVKTKTSVLLIPGLYDSPAQMKSLADHFHAMGLNVLSLRLRGQYELDPAAMSGTVQWADWKYQAEEALKIAETLGEKVLLVGHSTGALLVTWIAVERPKNIAGLALFAPAFGVHKLSRWFLRALDKTGFAIKRRDGFVISGHAGFEVEKLGEAFAENAASHAPVALRDVPVWLASTDLDLVINRRASEAFFESLQPSRRKRVAYRVHANRLVIHGTMTSKNTRAWGDMLESINNTFRLGAK